MLRSTIELSEYIRGLFDFKAKDYQLAFDFDCLTRPRVIGVFCRQSGKSENIGKVSIIKARFKKNAAGRYFDNYTVLVIAPTDRQAGLLAEKIRYSVHKMPYLSTFHMTRETQREFYFSNGAKIICETTGDTGESIRGYTGHCIILEEAGSIKDSIVQEVIMPMLATTDGDLIKIGTPRGKNHFYESSRNGLYAVHQYDWTHPVRTGLITQDYVDSARATMPDITFRTEMGAEFIEDQDAFFNYELIESCKSDTIQLSNSLPPIKAEGCTYYLGADIARLGQDSTCLTICAVGHDRKATIIHIVELRKCTLDVTMTKIDELDAYFHFTRMFIDETGLGAGVTDVLSKKYNMPKLQQGPQINKFPHNYSYGDRIVGIKFTIQSKLDMFSNLKTLMQQSRITYPDHPKLIAQLRDFRYEITDNQNIKLHHSEYGFDDFVDSLALACKEVNAKAVGYAF